MQSKKELKPKQIKAIAMMVYEGKSQKEAADELKLHYNTITNWKKDPDFIEALNKEVRKGLDSASAQALKTMVGLLTCRSDIVKFNAAKDILDRTGFKPTDKQEIDLTQQVVIVDDMPDEDD
ncbi:MAG: phBC6A51 family helix-turn-helix protein [Cellulosilyticaceae bacterium]